MARPHSLYFLWNHLSLGSRFVKQNMFYIAWPLLYLSASSAIGRYDATFNIIVSNNVCTAFFVLNGDFFSLKLNSFLSLGSSQCPNTWMVQMLSCLWLCTIVTIVVGHLLLTFIFLSLSLISVFFILLSLCL